MRKSPLDNCALVCECAFDLWHRREVREIRRVGIRLGPCVVYIVIRKIHWNFN